MITMFRADKRDFAVGEHISTASDYYDKFLPETKAIEDQLEGFRPEGKPKRRESLFLFPSLDAAKKHWSIMNDGKLYKVQIGDDQILHRADMHWLDVIANQIRNGEPTEESYAKYWSSEMTSNVCVEVLVASAIVVEVISKDQDERKAFLKERWKI
jgi:hypothetical protein